MPAQHSGLGSGMLQPQLRSQLQLGSDPWPRNSIYHGGAKQEKKKEREREGGRKEGRKEGRKKPR